MTEASMPQRLADAIREIDRAIDGNMRWMQAEHDRIGPAAGPFQPYVWPDKNGRPILADLLAAKANLLTALATIPYKPFPHEQSSATPGQAED
jgi:hypothetical protein